MENWNIKYLWPFVDLRWEVVVVAILFVHLRVLGAYKRSNYCLGIPCEYTYNFHH